MSPPAADPLAASEPGGFSTGPFGPVALRASAGELLNCRISSCLAGPSRHDRCAFQLALLGQLLCELASAARWRVGSAGLTERTTGQLRGIGGRVAAA